VLRLKCLLGTVAKENPKTQVDTARNRADCLTMPCRARKKPGRSPKRPSKTQRHKMMTRPTKTDAQADSRRGLQELDEYRPGDARHIAYLEQKEARKNGRAYRLQSAEIRLIIYRQNWLANVRGDTSLSAAARYAASILWDGFVDKQLFWNTGRLEAYPAVRTLAKKMSMGRSTAMRSVQELEKAGWLKVQRGGYNCEKNKMRANRYRMLNYRKRKPVVSKATQKPQKSHNTMCLFLLNKSRILGLASPRVGTYRIF
jgi:hypothetical protein